MKSPSKVGIVSIGEMGLGVAKLLIAHGYTVLTNISDRSDYTQKRAATASITLLDSDADLVSQVDYILSIVPPSHALATAGRFAITEPGVRSTPWYYLDLNAVSPGLAREIGALFENHPNARFIDGGIIGGPPQLIKQQDDSSEDPKWKCPSIPLSGPHPVPDEKLARVLNTTYLGPQIGSASGLKCCFASLSKGLSALSILSFSTAQSLGVYDELQRHLELFQPAVQARINRMLPGVPPKAGRWVQEMVEIGRCFGEEGGWDFVEGDVGADVFKHIAEVYKTLAQNTILGQERQEHRARGTTSRDVAVATAEGLRALRGGGEEQQ